MAVGVRKLTPTYGAAPQGAQAGLHAVPGKENDHLIATGNPVHERFLRLDHASVVEVVVLQQVESRSLEFARDGCCVVAGLFQFGCFLVGIVADDQRDPSAARRALLGEVAGRGRGLGRRAGLRGRGFGLRLEEFAERIEQVGRLLGGVCANQQQDGHGRDHRDTE